MALDVQGTDYLKLPVGTTAQRPSVPASGMIRQNSTTGTPEWWDATTSQWLPFSQNAGYTINYLIVAGGGSGGASAAGGGGAGGVLTGTSSLTAGVGYTITVGAGGAGVSPVNQGVNGSNSSIPAVTTSVGGGGGGRTTFAGSSGGSGGGGGGDSAALGGSATVGQGYAGGNGTGGLGGGGNWGASGSANTGGGGGAWNGVGTSGSGGSGIVIISYLGAQRGTGGTVTSSGGYTIHTFTSSGTYNA